MKPRTPWARDANPVGVSGRDFAQIEQARRHVREIREFYVNALMFAAVIPVLWAVNLLGTPKVLWAQWPTLGWGFGVLIHGMLTFGGRSLFGAEWEERKVQEILARERLRVVSREKQLVQAQLRMLQAQIEPHFLFNTLANVQMLVRKSPVDAQAILENLIAYLRQTLTASRAEMGTVKQELDLIRNYLELLRMRMGERLRFVVDAADDVLALSLPPMLLQPLVENAVKHGLEPKVEGGTVEVRAVREPHREGDHIVFTIRDDGLGFDPDRKRDEREVGGGVGLANLRERLTVLFDGEATFEIRDTSPGCEVRLAVPARLLASAPGAPKSQTARAVLSTEQRREQNA